MKRLVLLALVLLPSLAWAFPIDVQGCGNANPTAANVWSRYLTAGPEDFSRDFLKAGGAISCRFSWPSTDPASLTPTVWFDTAINTATSGSACLRAKISCLTASNDEEDNMAFGTAVDYSAALPGSYAATKVAKVTFSGPVTPNAHAAGALCYLYFARVDGVGGCANTIADANSSGILVKVINLN